MEYNPAIKRDELLIYTTKLNLKNIVLSAGSLKQRSTYYVIPLL